jgi:hypothetical protein
MTGAMQLGTTTADSTGRTASGWGTFSLQHTGTGMNLLWAAASAWQQWQAMNFGANWSNATIAGSTADPDKDGVTNEAERIFGTNPNTRQASALLTLEKTAPAQVTLTFTAVAASGPGFTGLTRRYTLESTTDLTNPASWQPVPGHQAIAGADQLVTTDQPIDTPRRCYRLKVWLE